MRRLIGWGVYTYDPAADPKWVANSDWEDPEA